MGWTPLAYATLPEHFRVSVAASSDSETMAAAAPSFRIHYTLWYNYGLTGTLILFLFITCALFRTFYFIYIHHCALRRSLHRVLAYVWQPDSLNVKSYIDLVIEFTPNLYAAIKAWFTIKAL